MPARRRSVRLRHHDYRGGLYFVTVCTHGRRPLFGHVVDGRMVRSWRGEIAHVEWLQTEEVRPDVVLDAFVVMPDHVHLLFGIVPPPDGEASRPGPESTGGATRRVAPTDRGGRPAKGPPPRTVGAVVGQYKSVVTKRVRRIELGARVWQRSFYDRVVRTAREADAIRRYIEQNPARWAHRGDRRDGHRI